MTISVSVGSVVVQLPEDLEWVNEFSENPVEQSADWSLTGALILDVGVKQAGIPIVLRGSDVRALVPRSTVDALKLWRDMPGQVMRLSLRWKVFQVVWDHKSGALDASPAWGVYDAPADWPHAISLRFLTV